MDAQTCHLIVLDKRINSMTEFKQIIGRGTCINEEYGKLYFTIMDFKRATVLFADLAIDGEPVQIYEPGLDDPPLPPEEVLCYREEQSSPSPPRSAARAISAGLMTSRSASPPSGSSTWTATAG